MVANPERGEVSFEVGDHKGVLCAEMGRLAALSGAVGTKSISELMQRIHGMEPMTMFHAIDALLTEGDAKAIKAGMRTPNELSAVMGAVVQSMSILWETDEKKPEGETETKG